MKRHFPGLHSEPHCVDNLLEGIFLVRVDRAYYRWHPQKPFFVLCFAILEPKELASRKISGRLYCTQKSLAGRMFLNLDAFAPSSEWEFISKDARESVLPGGSHDLQLHAD